MSISSDQYIGYVSRESDLDNVISSLVQTKNDGAERLRGWNTYYKGTGGGDQGHKNYIDDKWEKLPKNESDDLTNPTKFSKQWYMNKVSPYNASTGDYTDSNWTQYSIDNLTSDKKANAIKAAKRMLARDFHRGHYYFAEGNPGHKELPEGQSGQEKGFNTYVIPIYTSPRSGNTKESIIRLNADETNFLDDTWEEAAITEWGQFHWDNDGKYEDRVLPGAKFSVKDGKLQYKKEFVGSGLTDNYDSIVDSFEGSSGGNYKDLIEGIGNNALKDKPSYLEDFDAGDYDLLSAYYQNEKITPLDVTTLEQPPKLGFDAGYYLGTTYGLAAAQKWNNAQNSVLGYLPDLDVVGAYGGNYENYLHDYYSEIKRSGISDLENRGNAAEATEAANTYLESWDNLVAGNAEATLAQQEMFRDQMLGLTNQSPSGAYSVEWDEPFVTDEKGNIVYEIDEDGNRTPVINTEAVSFLESSVFNVFGKKDLEQQDKFKALALDVLTNAVDKLNKEKKRENELSIYMGLPGFNEIYGANSSIANSLLGDSGIGGFFSMAGLNVDAMTESLENQLSGVTGISNNSSVYNWQKWFDENLLKRYEEMEEITGKLGADIEELNPILDNKTWTSFQASADDYQTKITNRENKVAKAQEALDELEGQLDNLLTELEENETENIEQNENVISLLEEIKKAKTNLDNKTKKLNKIVEQKDNFLAENNMSKGLSIERALEIASPESWQALLSKYDLPSDLNKEEAVDILTNSEEKINKIYTIEDDFKRTFIDEYIKPRFDQSKSMDEFISYLDTLDEDEQNVFQTQDAMQALKTVASAYSAAKLNQIEATPDAYFDSAFYFDPTVAIDERFKNTKDDSYRTQAEQVQADYEAALANPNAIVEGSVTEAEPEGVTWNQFAYFYGVDLADKDQFARLHYDAIGKSRGYDPAKDVTSVADIKGYIVDTVIPKVSEAQLDLGDAAFSEFVTPEEFADHLLKGIDPTENNPEWKEILKQFGLDEAASLDELKEYLIDITRTGAAKEIREAIKYLNEKKLTPTQERLGVSYIEREEDANPIDEEGTSALFQIFADAGYAGTEDEFFTEFMPDADRGDIEFLTQTMGDGFSLETISDDPFVALSQVGGLMGDSDSDIFGSGPSQDDNEEEKSNYFDLFPEEDDYYSDAGRDYIKEYTSFFSS